jgi:stearoyl-CoA desaturase (delta-9 desaturase)
MTAVLDSPPPAARRTAEPALQQVPSGMLKARVEQASLLFVVTVPFLAVLAAVPVAWGRYISWRDVAIAIVMYAVTGHGITVGFHRYFTHGSFKARRWVRVTLAVLGSMAIEGPVKRWVADHRRHHAYSDAEGDPHSPHRYGEGFWPMTKGLFHAHMGWLFDSEQTNQRRFIPDLLDDRAIRVVDRLFAPLAIVSLGAPALLGWVFSGFTLAGALTAFFWGGLVRVFLLHHVTWSVNSICHTVGATPFRTRDKAKNFWPLALLSMGESWHNLHHSDPTSARHGVLRGQIDTSARLIRILEALQLVYDVRWPSPERVASRRVHPA